MNLRRYRVLLGSVVILAVSVLGGFLALRHFRVSEIRVIGTSIRVEIDEKQLPGNLIFFPASWYENQLKKEYPQLSTVKIRKVFPDTLELEVTTREPVARVQIGTSDFFVDDKGYATGTSDPAKKYPLIQLPDTVMLGFPLKDPMAEQALKFVSGVKSVEVMKITSTDATSLRAQTPDLDIFFSRDTDISSVDRTLQTLITGFRIKAKAPKMIDLRFQKPIVTF